MLNFPIHPIPECEYSVPDLFCEQGVGPSSQDGLHVLCHGVDVHTSKTFPFQQQIHGPEHETMFSSVKFIAEQLI